MGLTISLNRVSFLPPPVRNNIFYEIETSSTRLYNTGLGAQSTGGSRSSFWRKTFKNDGKFRFGSPYLPPLLRKSGFAPGLLRHKLGNTYYHATQAYNLRHTYLLLSFYEQVYDDDKWTFDTSYYNRKFCYDNKKKTVTYPATIRKIFRAL